MICPYCKQVIAESGIANIDEVAKHFYRNNCPKDPSNKNALRPSIDTQLDTK